VRAATVLEHPLVRRARVLVLLARPAVLVLGALYCALGPAEAGRAEDPGRLAVALAAVFGCLIFAVAVNDLADEAVDRVNLRGDRRRPLVTGSGTRREMQTVAVTSAVVAMAASAVLRWPAFLVVVGCLVLSAAYSLRPIRLSGRGVVAPILLPAGFVAAPFLLGIMSVRGTVTVGDLTMMGALYVGFIGRIVLKDFRDVRGDALFGKRTFLVRHGRRATCRLSAGCWVAGASVLAVVRGVTPELCVAVAVLVVAALGLLAALAHDRGARRDEWLISAIAIVGRGTLLVVLAHLAMLQARWSAPAQVALFATLTAVTVGQARTMARRGPVTTLRLADLVADRLPADMRPARSTIEASGSSSPDPARRDTYAAAAPAGR